MIGAPKAKRICRNCQNPYDPSPKFSFRQYSQSKYCSPKCAGEARRIKDGMTKGERHRRKKGMAKRSSPEWIERIRAKTTEAMKKPEIQWKLRQPRAPMTDAGKAIRSDALAGRTPTNIGFGGNNGYQNIQRGEYECSKGAVYFRSKWEANYALFLDWLVKKGEIKEWEFEPDKFIFEAINFGTRSYTPDFKVINNNGSIEYHEVKGYMDGKSKTKLKRMAKYYPDVKLILIDSAYYRDLAKKVGKMLGFY